MAETVKVVVGLHQVRQRVENVVSALSSLADAPANFHAFGGTVITTTSRFLLTAAIHVPFLLHCIVNTLLVEHLQVLQLDVTHVVERDVTLRTLLTHLTVTAFPHTGTTVIHQIHQDKHGVYLMLGKGGKTCDAQQTQDSCNQ